MSMSKVTYIKTESGQIILFPPTISHDKFEQFKPVSAGFAQIYNDEITCFGESFTLGLKSDSIDSELATRQYFKIPW